MEDILVDYHIAKALAAHADKSPDARNYDQALYIEAVMAKHGVTKQQFDSSLVYYYTRSDRFEPIYRRVSERLEQQALTLGANDGEIGKYADAKGDTANIWSGRMTLLMLPKPPYNHWDFEVVGDSVFRRGDSFLFQFMSDFMYHSGSHSAVLYVAVDYNDTTISRQVRFTATGLNKLDIMPREDKDIKGLRGFFYLHDDDPTDTSARLLFLNNIQLIRFHKQKQEDEDKKDSMSSTDTGEPLVTDTLSDRDTLGRSPEVVPAGKRIAPDRVVKRMHKLETRP